MLHRNDMACCFDGEEWKIRFPDSQMFVFKVECPGQMLGKWTHVKLGDLLRDLYLTQFHRVRAKQAKEGVEAASKSLSKGHALGKEAVQRTYGEAGR